jgi:tetratricopeptide (TPR) repeat protein
MTQQKSILLGVLTLALILVLVGKTNSQGMESVHAAPISKMAMPKAALMAEPVSAQAVTSARQGLDVPDVSDLYREAEGFIAAGRLPEAVAAYEKVVVQKPALAETYLRLGLIYFKLNLPTKAEAMYEQAISRGLDAPDVYFHLGYIKEVRGALNLALADYLKAEQKGSTNPELFYNIGNAYARMDKRQEALSYYKRTVSIDPGHMNAFVNLSVVSFQMGLYADAQFYLDKAAQLGYKADPQYLQILKNKH